MKKLGFILILMSVFACTSGNEIQSLRTTIEEMIICLEQKGLNEFFSKHLYPDDIERMMNNDIENFTKDLPDDTANKILSSLKDTRNKNPEKLLGGRLVRFPGKLTEGGMGFIKEQGAWYLINILVEPVAGRDG